MISVNSVVGAEEVNSFINKELRSCKWKVHSYGDIRGAGRFIDIASAYDQFMFHGGEGRGFSSVFSSSFPCCNIVR